MGKGEVEIELRPIERHPSRGEYGMELFPNFFAVYEESLDAPTQINFSL
jgi:hypothetical protein